MEFWPIINVFHRLWPYLCSKQVTLGFYKQATHRRPGDEPFFLLWGPLFMTGDGPKMVHLGSKLAKHGRLFNVPKWSKMVNPSVFDHLGPLWAHLDPFWPFPTKIDFLLQTLLCPFGAKNYILSEMVQMGPDEPKRVLNGQKHLGWPYWSLLDPFDPLWNVDEPAMFGPSTNT